MNHNAESKNLSRNANLYCLAVSILCWKKIEDNVQFSWFSAVKFSVWFCVYNVVYWSHKDSLEVEALPKILIAASAVWHKWISGKTEAYVETSVRFNVSSDKGDNNCIMPLFAFKQLSSM